MPPEAELNKISELADQCVKCGLCLPHCPTYNIAQQENESPRGRISIIQGIVAGQIKAADAQPYLEHCLECRRCEAVCPASVQFGELMDLTKAHLFTNKSGKWISRAMPLLSKTVRFRLAAILYYCIAWLIPIRVARSMLDRSKAGISRLAFFAPPRIWPAALSRDCGTGEPIYLFTGCVASGFDATTLRHTQLLLTELGYRVLSPGSQACCGALTTHNGHPEQSAQLESLNLEAFKEFPDAPILMLASGCQAHLLSTRDAFKQRVTDIGSILTAKRDELKSRLSPMKKVIAVQTPCTLRNVVKKDSEMNELLGLIPEATLFRPADNDQCCGAAGSYFINSPDYSDKLQAAKIDALTAGTPDIIASSNVGCSLHLQSGLRDRDMKIPVMHPASLIYLQLIKR